MYRLIVESLLGLTLEKNRLVFMPCLPPEWDGVTVHYRFCETIYHITVKQSRTGGRQPARVTINGVVQAGQEIDLVDDGSEHTVEVLV
jgi:cellobiose phosphorylase